MSEEITESDLKAVIGSLADSFEKELHDTPQDDLDRYWHFKWNDSISIERNVYMFHDMLKLYGTMCRQWEEHHGGSCCVVERVRDKYLMPKIREFIWVFTRSINAQRAK